MTPNLIGSERLSRLRLWVLGVLVLGLVGTLAELLLLEHYEDPWQFVPLVLIGLAAFALIWLGAGGSAASRMVFQLLMVLFCIAGLVGLVLHFRGAVQFQRELDPSIAGWDLIKKVMRVKAPPVLAPGVMLQLGLI